MELTAHPILCSFLMHFRYEYQSLYFHTIQIYIINSYLNFNCFYWPTRMIKHWRYASFVWNTANLAKEVFGAIPRSWSPLGSLWFSKLSHLRPSAKRAANSLTMNCIICHPRNTSIHVRSIHRMWDRNILVKDQLKNYCVRAVGHCMHLLRFHLLLNSSIRLLFLFTLNFILVSSLTVIRRVNT